MTYTHVNHIKLELTPVATAPVMSFPGGGYYNDISVSITTELTGANIYYTTDGSVPDGTDTLYTTPISLSTDTILRAIAIKTGYTSSAVTTENYRFTVATPFVNPASGIYYEDKSVTMSTTTSGASIYYTTDGSTPDSGDTLYSGVFTLTSGANQVRAIGIKSGYNDSVITRRDITINYIYLQDKYGDYINDVADYELLVGPPS